MKTNLTEPALASNQNHTRNEAIFIRKPGSFRRFAAERFDQLVALKERIATNLEKEFAGTIGVPLIRQIVTEAEALAKLSTDSPRVRAIRSSIDVARAEALAGISSTLSLPILGDGHVVGGVNLYGATSDAFDGHHEDLADACGAWAAGAVTNADLRFNSRVRAAATPGSDSRCSR